MRDFRYLWFLFGFSISSVLFLTFDFNMSPVVTDSSYDELRRTIKMTQDDLLSANLELGRIRTSYAKIQAELKARWTNKQWNYTVP